MRAMNSARAPVARAMLSGALGFAVVSLAAYAVWAFAGGWFRGRGGEPAMYAAIAAVFLALTGAVLHPLVRGERRLARFYGAFVPAFFAYAVAWSGFWFWLRYGAGEWLGALAGCAVFVALTAWRLGGWRAFWPALAVFFVLHTAGYFAGGFSMARLMALAREAAAGSPERAQLAALAKLSWGLFHGLGFGAGLGFAYHALQSAAGKGAAGNDAPHDERG
jgi:hypothetical protein